MISTTQLTQKHEDAIQEIYSLLVFRLGEQAFALNIESVIQVIPMLRLTPLPQVNHMIEGIANIHGMLVPVVSARRHLSLPDVKLELYTPIILAMVGERQIGWIVDEVTEVISVPAELIIAPGDILPEGMENAPVISGLIYQQNSSVIMLDPRYILRPSEFRKIDQAFHFSQQPNAAALPQAPNEAAELPLVSHADQISIKTICAELARNEAETQRENQNEEPQPAPEKNEEAVIAAAIPPETSPIPSSESYTTDTPNLRDGETTAAVSEKTPAPPETSSSPGNSPVTENQPVEETAKDHKTGKRRACKGKIIPNTGRRPHAQGQKARRNIQAVIAEQFAALAKEILETDKKDSSETNANSDWVGE